MAQLLQNSGAGASIPYMFLPGNHEVSRVQLLDARSQPHSV